MTGDEVRRPAEREKREQGAQNPETQSEFSDSEATHNSGRCYNTDARIEDDVAAKLVGRAVLRLG